MRRFCTVFLLCCHCLLLVSIGVGQTARHYSIEKDDISTLIPPLAVLIDSAIAHNPGLKSKDLSVMVNRYALQAFINSLSKNHSVSADVRYGTFTNYATDALTNLAVSTNKSEFRYGIGGTVKFMIADVLDRKNQIRMAKTEIDIARSDYEEKQIELRKIVIQQYNDLILRQRLMKLAAKNLETVKINMQMAEKEFLNGVIPLTEYTNISAGVANTEAGFENARMDFLNAYMILEEIVGMKFNIVNTIPENYERN